MLTIGLEHRASILLCFAFMEMSVKCVGIIKTLLDLLVLPLSDVSCAFKFVTCIMCRIYFLFTFIFVFLRRVYKRNGEIPKYSAPGLIRIHRDPDERFNSYVRERIDFCIVINLSLER